MNKQAQHIIPRIYLEQFSYKHGTQKFVCVRNKTETYNRNKSIKSFLTEINIFDLKNVNRKAQRLYEDSINGVLESFYPQIVNEIENNSISDKSDSFLRQFVANLYCRSKFHREMIKELLAKPKFRENWIGMLIYFLENDEVDAIKGIRYDKEYLQKLKNYYLNSDIEEILNPILLLETKLFVNLLYQLKVIILKCPNDDFKWFTSDNPVIVNKNLQNPERFQILGIDSEVYFPLSPKYMAVFFHSNSEIKDKFRTFEAKTINEIDEEDINYIIQTHIIPNVHEYLIFPEKI